ncbi:MAG: N-acetyltransferase [Phycisphaerales bacterium]|nr:N-acetyltransferase [Phycisphaerales bacterium]
MTTSSLQPVLIEQQDRQEAIRCLLPPGSGRLQAARFERFATENRIGLDWLWACKNEEGQVRCSALCVPSPGRTAMVFLSPVIESDQIQERAALLRHVLSELRAQPLDLAQVLLSCDDMLARRTHTEGGFRELASLLYMERPLSRRDVAPEPPPGAEVVTWTPELETTLAGVLKASYESTLDCPGLCGLRQTKDIIAGHRSTGKHNPSFWKLLRCDGEFCGCILVNPGTTRDTTELVYLGLAPCARGKGMGRYLLDTMFAEMSRGPWGRMTLAVDTLNRPAIRLYEQRGFRGSTHRLAMIHSLSDA